jgi:hypothetical protein
MIIEDYSRTQIYITDGWRVWYVPKFRILMEVSEPYLSIYWTEGETGSPQARELTINYADVSGYGYANPTSAADLKAIIEDYIDSAWTDIGPGGDLLVNAGDLLTHDATSDTILPVGSNEYILQVNTALSKKLNWVAPTAIVSAANIGSAIAASALAAPNDTDYVATADAGVLEKITWANVKAFLKTYFNTLYATTFSKNTVTQTLAASGNNQAITNVTIAIAANKTMLIEVVLQVDASATNGWRVAVAIPTGATMNLQAIGTQTATSSFGAASWLTTSGVVGATTGQSATMGPIISTTQQCTIKGWVTTAGTAGTIDALAAPTNVANTVKIVTGSWIKGNYTN